MGNQDFFPKPGEMFIVIGDESFPLSDIGTIEAISVNTEDCGEFNYIGEQDIRHALLEQKTLNVTVTIDPELQKKLWPRRRLPRKFKKTLKKLGIYDLKRLFMR
ncbi:MAG: hypothetical protein ACK5LC_14055 [Coprobacillaceae bacterium]